MLKPTEKLAVENGRCKVFLALIVVGFGLLALLAERFCGFCAGVRPSLHSNMWRLLTDGTDVVSADRHTNGSIQTLSSLQHAFQSVEIVAGGMVLKRLLQSNL